MRFKTVFVILFATVFLTGCGAVTGSSDNNETQILLEDASAVDSEVYESIHTESIPDISTETYADVFDSNYNSYYDVKNGKAVPRVGEATTETTGEAIDENTEGTEATTAEVDVVFKDGKSNTKSNSTPQKQSYSAISNITRTITAEEQFIDFENNTECDNQFILMDAGKVLYDSGVIQAGSKASWDAYTNLSTGFHELEYQYIQMKDGEVILTYAGVANITVEGGKDD